MLIFTTIIGKLFQVLNKSKNFFTLQHMPEKKKYIKQFTGRAYERKLLQFRRAMTD